jgi:DNA-binding CsgD family transcriptional regulator
MLIRIATGAPEKDIAEALDLDPQTAGQHLTSIFGKLGVTSLDELDVLLALSPHQPPDDFSSGPRPSI